MRDQTKALTALLAAAAIAGPAAAAAQTPIQPGYWESTNKLLSPIHTTSTERRCITPADVDKFLAGPSNRHYNCSYPIHEVRNGRISMRGTCVSKNGRRVAVSGEGHYTPTSFTLTAQVATEFAGLAISGRASTEARRLGDTCPAPDSEAD